jgi:hypothetical protein
MSGGTSSGTGSETVQMDMVMGDNLLSSVRKKRTTDGLLCTGSDCRNCVKPQQYIPDTIINNNIDHLVFIPPNPPYNPPSRDVLPVEVPARLNPHSHVDPPYPDPASLMPVQVVWNGLRNGIQALRTLFPTEIPLRLPQLGTT